MSGICEGPAARQHCPAAAAAAARPPPGAPTDDGLAAARDAELACVVDPSERAQRVREAAAWTWKGYRDCAWGQDELRALSCSGQHWLNLTLTAVDGLDTLYVMGLTKEFEQAAECAAAAALLRLTCPPLFFGAAAAAG
jgi:mannosyl-oligosaccharide alpha-1,2-mannosidase